MKKNIFTHTWAIVAAIFGSTISGMIVNSYTKWWGALANLTTTVWEAVSQATVSAITYKVPIWTVVVAVALVALIWYATRKIGGALKVAAPSFLSYRQDFFDGVLCRWDYYRPYLENKYEVRNIGCFCQHCDFIIGTPNEHVQQCPSCSTRPVKFDNPPYRIDPYSWGSPIKGYQCRESPMPFEDFIRREIDRRIRTGEWRSSSKE